MRKTRRKGLVIYPGSQHYNCMKCGEDRIPRTFKLGHPICADCAFKFKLNPIALELNSNAIPRIK